MQGDYKRVILLSVDALRKDRVNSDYGRNLSPFLSKLAEENTEFLNCFSTSSHTREAMSAMLTGIHPFRANREGMIPENAPGGGFHLDAETVASYLDVETGGFHSNPFLSRSFGYGEDWDKFDDDLYLGRSKILTLLNRFLEKLTNRHYSRATEINSKSLEWIDSLEDASFFLWNHYMDPHGPYQPPQDTRGEYQENPLGRREAQRLLKKAMNNPEEISEEDRNRLIDLYDEEVLYTDRQIENFFEELEERNILNESLVIIVGDHGEAFGQNGFFEHGGALTEELVRVPLVLVDGQERTVESPASLTDIVPTVLSVFGQEDLEDLDGRNLLEVADENRGTGDRTVFFQETKNQDPIFGGSDGESISTVEVKDREILRTENESDLEKDVKEYAENALDGEKQEQDENVEEEVKERLEALGYTGEKSR